MFFTRIVALNVLKQTCVKVHRPCGPVLTRVLSGTASDRDDEKNTDFCSFPVPDLNTLPDELRERLSEIAEKSGFMPNIFSGLSYRPEQLRAFFGYYDVVMEKRGNVTVIDKEVIAIATAGENRCLYCVLAHGAKHRLYSKNHLLADQLAINWRTADLDPRQRAILEFAMDVKDCKPLSQEHFSALEQHGLSKDDAWDIGSSVAFFAMSNRLSFLLSIKPNPEFHLLGRLLKEKN